MPLKGKCSGNIKANMYVAKLRPPRSFCNAAHIKHGLGICYVKLKNVAPGFNVNPQRYGVLGF